MRILLAIDGSESSVQARDMIASLPWPEGTSITVLTAYELPVSWVSGVAVTGGDWMETAENDLRRQLTEDLAELARPLEGRGWTVERRVVDGRPGTLILEVAREIEADLIVLGSRGHGTMRAMLLGSVSAEVSGNADRSVLVVRGDRATRLLVATDGSDCASAIPGVLGEWGVFRGLPAIATSIAPVDSPAYELMVSLYTLGAAPLDQQRKEQLEAHRRHAESMAEALSEIGLQAEPVVGAGDAAHELVKLAGEREADLVVTGSRCLHGIERWVLGSVARNVVLHAEASVLVIRRPQKAGA
ncbi:MAG TPA: universal stress protein [Candidatus Limnocylindria bacterium]